MSWQEHLQKRHAEHVDANRWRARLTLESPQTAEVKIDGQRYDNFCSNDYLGLANDPRLIAAAQSAAGELGVGSGASHLICGHQSPHQQLESALASFVGAQQSVSYTHLTLPTICSV